MDLVTFSPELPPWCQTCVKNGLLLMEMTQVFQTWQWNTCFTSSILCPAPYTKHPPAWAKTWIHLKCFLLTQLQNSVTNSYWSLSKLFGPLPFSNRYSHHAFGRSWFLLCTNTMISPQISLTLDSSHLSLQKKAHLHSYQKKTSRI